MRCSTRTPHDRPVCAVIELKTGEFKPEYPGKINFYLSAVDAQLRGGPPEHGLVLCKGKNKVVVEYALRDTKKPSACQPSACSRSCRPS
jgi:YhcG PDDEXK nuclease domain